MIVKDLNTDLQDPSLSFRMTEIYDIGSSKKAALYPYASPLRTYYIRGFTINVRVNKA